MRTPRAALAAAALAAAAPVHAQLSTHGIALESGIYATPGAREPTRPSLALSATAWLDGEAEAVVRVALRSEARTDGRGTAPALCATGGLRLSLAPDPLRPQVQLEIGWLAAPEAPRGLAVGAGGGIEWFPARDLSLAARLALRGTPAAPRLEASLSVGAYF